ncbi:MAG: tRNA(Ile)-lysidine synthetase, partial [Propionibacteriaceae bacterium]|nr:tRNA(Ile)-lysidine synthetase [Propionibacteriaceae bacterium]
MARRALSPACLGLVQAVESQVPAALAAAGCGRLRIGLSGGADSLALAAAVAWAAARPSGALAQVPAEAVVVDHGLQAASAAVAARAASQAEKLGLPARVVQVAVAPGPDGLEAAARAARYDALLDDPAALVLVAHTLDDQA